jgi:hypothetical protein
MVVNSTVQNDQLLYVLFGGGAIQLLPMQPPTDSTLAACEIDQTSNVVCNGYVLIFYLSGQQYSTVYGYSTTDLGIGSPSKLVCSIGSPPDNPFTCQPVNGATSFYLQQGTLIFASAASAAQIGGLTLIDLVAVFI